MVAVRKGGDGGGGRGRFVETEEAVDDPRRWRRLGWQGRGGRGTVALTGTTSGSGGKAGMGR